MFCTPVFPPNSDSVSFGSRNGHISSLSISRKSNSETGSRQKSQQMSEEGVGRWVLLLLNGLSGAGQVCKFSPVGMVLDVTAHLWPPSPCPCLLSSAAALGSERCRRFCPLPPRPSWLACPCPTRLLPPLAPAGQKPHCAFISDRINQQHTMLAHLSVFQLLFPKYYWEGGNISVILLHSDYNNNYIFLFFF